MNTVSDTYDREYLDRVSDKPITGFWQARGVSTLQDWVLFFFFTIYGIISLGLFFLVISMSDSPVYAGGMIAISSIGIGIMITAVLIRFG